MSAKTAVIIGAGPAGLTTAYEFLTRTDVHPIVLEMSDYLGGISRTVNYKGNRIDIGGHRFFSKDDRVMEWWANMMPLAHDETAPATITYQKQTRELPAAMTAKLNQVQTPDQVMLVRPRKSRIYFKRKFFDYPLSLNAKTLTQLGPVAVAKIGMSYIKSRLFPIKPERNLEEFFINRFGRELYLTFFKSYTEKVWGVPCQEISAEWGAQRIKGLSITKAVLHAMKKILPKSKDIRQKGVETSLIEQFLYPKYGPGQMWETCAEKIKMLGGEVIQYRKVKKILMDGNKVTGVIAVNTQTGEEETYNGDYVFSTMPIKELLRELDTEVPANVLAISDGLQYRDFMTVGLLLEDLKIKEDHPQGKKLLSDTWIYIQEPDVQVGRLQIFNNWSPHMVQDPKHVWIGLEYFCYEGDALWNRSDEDLKQLGKEEMVKIGMIDAKAVVDATVIRMPKTYPAYFGEAYEKFDEMRAWVDKIPNLFLIGRNGMHRYNNQDHSMLTAMTAVDNIIAGRVDKTNLWEVNTEKEYHETKDKEQASEAEQKPVSV
jgi:protoporphyrinogen oxidase